MTLAWPPSSFPTQCPARALTRGIQGVARRAKDVSVARSAAGKTSTHRHVWSTTPLDQAMCIAHQSLSSLVTALQLSQGEGTLCQQSY
jgi:hypothetical protein